MSKAAAIGLCFFLALILQGCNAMATVTRGVAEFNATVKSNPDILNNQSIVKVHLNSSMDPNVFDGVVLENMTIRNLTLRDVQMRGARLKNVTFVDCKFIKTDFSHSTLSNVKFIRGTMSGYKRGDNYDAYETSFQKVTIDRVLFDGVYFDKNVDLDLRGGIVVMRNITTGADSDKASCLLSGSDLQLRMDNCTVTNQIALLVRGGNNTAYITNSRFSNTTPQDKQERGAWDPGLRLQGKAAWIENCILEGATPATKKAVITNCVLGDVAVQSGGDNSKAFLINNKYTPTTRKKLLTLCPSPNRINETAFVYLYAGGTPIPHSVYVESGNVSIFDTEIGELSMRQQRFGTALPSLNLSNVTIKKGDLEYADWRQGKWDNVRVYPPVDLNYAKIGKIIGHKVEFPQGTPWVNGTLEIVNSYEPLELDKPPVPTLEELGLAQFWKENDFPVETY